MFKASKLLPNISLSFYIFEKQKNLITLLEYFSKNKYCIYYTFLEKSRERVLEKYS